MTMVKTGQLWRHFKGNLYEVLAVAMMEEDHERIVVYQRHDIPDSTVWARPLREWQENIERAEYHGPRYVLIGVNA
jgi:hypothetical protein